MTICSSCKKNNNYNNNNLDYKVVRCTTNEFGRHHSFNDKPAVICRTNDFSLKTKIWYKNGYIHRDKGPSIVKSNGHEEWTLLGLLHREDGPARKYPNGEIQYALFGAIYPEKEYNKEVRKNKKNKRIKNVLFTSSFLACLSLLFFGCK